MVRALKVVKNGVVLPGNKYFEYEKRKVTQSVKLANEWLLMEAYGSELDISKLKFREKGAMLSEVTTAKAICHDDKPFQETGDFSVGGNRYTEVDNSGDYFDQFIAKAAQDSLAAYRWAIPLVLSLNGKEIKDKDFEERGAIAFADVGVLIQWLSAFL